MCLSLSEWRALHKIDKTMRCADPRLASLLAIFTRLAASEAMPAHERLRYRGSQIRAALALVIWAVLRVISQVLALATRTATRLRARSRPSRLAEAGSARSARGAPPGAAL
jgi:hypothetical protein